MKPSPWTGQAAEVRGPGAPMLKKAGPGIPTSTMEQIDRPTRAQLFSATAELLVDCAQEAAQRRTVRRQRVAAALALLGVLCGAAVPLLQPRRYRARSRLQMYLRTAPANGQGRLSKQGMADQRELMLGRTFLQEVVRNLSPRDREKLFGGVHIRPGKHARSEEAELASQRLAGLAIEIQPPIRMMEISFPSDDPGLALAVVTAAVAAAEDVGLRLRTERAARVSIVLRERLDALERDIQQGELRQEADSGALARMRGLGGGSGGSGPYTLSAGASEASMSRAARKLARRTRKSYTRLGTVLAESEPAPDPLLLQLARALNEATLVRRLAESRANAFRSLESTGQTAALESQSRGADREELDRLQLQLAQSSAQTAALAAQAGPQQPALRTAQAAERELTGQLHRMDLRLVASAEAGAAFARAREAGVQREFDRQKRVSSAAAVAQVENQLPELNLAVEEDLDAVQTEVLRSAETDAALKAFGFTVIDPPAVPETRQPRRWKLPLTIGALAGVAAGLLAALLMYVFELGIWDPFEAERESGLSLVAVLPRGRAAHPEASPEASAAAGPAVLGEPSGLYGSAVGELAAKLEAYGGGSSVPVVLLTSATAGEGKSTTAASLAVMLARGGSRLLLVDADLHRPTLHRLFGLRTARGLAEVLAGRLSLAECVQPVAGEPGLEVLVAGPRAQAGSQLMQSGAMEALLHALRASPGADPYRFILMDAPSTLGSSDSAYLASLSDILLFVARFRQVDLRSLRRGVKLLGPAAPPVTGLVINGIPADR